ncbi:MAG: hypothetical protein OEV40_12990 [Acidimicrobiia bacterium]|nr:hypothetical protein [Acidimicrobiia bacterium]
MRRELILYATPTGPLAEACARYFRCASRLGTTEAQGYPPHCTLTGFFHRTPERVDEVVRETTSRLVAAGPVPDDAVIVKRLGASDAWVGLELSSSYLLRLTEELFVEHRLDAGDDPVRGKDWLHLSLAYGVDDLAPYGLLAESVVDPSAPAGWEVALWERRRDGTWRRFE